MVDINNRKNYYPNPSGEGTGAAKAAPRVFVYIDGFNLYYRCLKNTPYKWLDLKALCRILLNPSDQIIKIKLFTARVSARPDDPGQPTRQDVYFRALKTHIPELDIIYGSFQSHQAKGYIAPNAGKGWVHIIKTDEKGSDVNLAVHLLNDAWLDKYDMALLISNDSDLAESINLAKSECRKKIGWLITDKNRPSKQLAQIADFRKKITDGVLEIAQLPDPIGGSTISRPKEWHPSNYHKNSTGDWKRR